MASTIKICILFLTLLQLCFCLKYPENCKVSGDEISCYLNDGVNFNNTSSHEQFSTLKLICSQNTTVTSQTLTNFQKLREIHLFHCPNLKLTILYSLNELRNLTIQSYNETNLEQFSFSQLKQLENINLAFNNIKNIPELFFCPLKNLVSLNVSHNKFQDIKDFGFQMNDDESNISSIKNVKNEIKTNCNLNIQTLDLSYNNFRQLNSKTLNTLKRLNNLKLNNNELKLISDDALNGLTVLRKFDVSNNNLVALPSILLQESLDIREIYFQNNSLTTLPNGLFSKLEQLLILDLSRNQLATSSINKQTFSGLIRLVLLNLSFNRITNLYPYFFKDLYTLQILNLESNLLENIPTNTFSPMNNLHTLILSYNRLQILQADLFQGLYALSLLSLDNNLLHTIHKDALRNCSALQDLNLNGNSLTKIPGALQNMRLLRTVDLGENKIEQLDEPNLNGMNNLNGLRLLGNDIKIISNKAFSELPNLQILNLSRNKIKKIEKRAFVLNKDLQAIRLDANLLTNITGIFNNIPTLIWLNISDNLITKFDYLMIPINLKWLDLHKNKIDEINNIKNLKLNMKLQTLDISYNYLSHIKTNSLPNNIELALLNDNQISKIDINSFLDKINLKRVDLYANEIMKMDLNSLRLNPINGTLPEFYIGGNPFECDCTMEWLQRINTLTYLKIYPNIKDIENIYCKLPYNREKNFISLIETEPSHFVCEYKDHCFALCHCCDFDACDCKMTCPNNCTCYHDQTWSAANIVDCTNSNYDNLPSRIPMDATEVYLDGNNLPILISYSFIGRKNLKTLYINNSKVELIHNHTFSGLKLLQILHLENNHLKELNGFEFNCLSKLRELYLNNNQLNYIHNSTFIDLKSLEVLRLDGNRLHLYPVWLFLSNPYLARITLSNNNWSCHCQYLREFRNWLKINYAKVSDAVTITCVLRYDDTKHLGPYLADFNSSACSSYLSGVGYLDSDYSNYSKNHLILLLIVILCTVITVSLIFIITYNRRKLKLWCYTRLCFNSKKSSTNITLEDCLDDKTTRQYDAYISYSIKDENFLTQILIPRLEQQQYKLKLHHKDFNICSYIADIILEGVENSNRTILILSTNFLSTEWCRFEFKSAFREAMQRDVKYNNSSKKRLIIIIFGDLPSRDLDPDLRVYLNKTAICIKWGDSRFWEKLRYAMPDTTSNIKIRGDTLKGSLYYCCNQSEDAAGSAASNGRQMVTESPALLLDCCEPSPTNKYSGVPSRSSVRTLQHQQRGSVWA